MYRSLPLLLLFVSSLPLCSAEDALKSQVATVIARRCLECHNGRDAKGGLNLASRDSILKGGESGEAIVVGQPEHSLLIERVANGEMPPEVHGKPQPLSAEELDGLKRWIADGAAWPEGRVLDLFETTTDVRAGTDWWSLQPPQRPPVPQVAGQTQTANPIDAFVFSRLEAAGMTPAPPADRRALIRRVYSDLIGLPPTSNEINAFVQDDSADAYERLIDRLLASAHYGERWARHWLDVVRFAETCGYERDQLKPNIWRYRDWVIKSLNDDMPYDQFVTWQLAGDEIDQPSEQSVIATGMIRAGTWNDEPNDPQDYLYERLEDMVHVTTSAFLGLTVKCARCHDHKFDPIKQTDYYRTAALFWGGYIGQENLGGPNDEQLGYDVCGWTDKSNRPPPIRLLINGERHSPGEVVEPGFLSSIAALDQPLKPPPAKSKTTHRRKQFANWITNPANPLTARVLVNRLWLNHFGEGIVRTPNNFGFKSDPPTHPELLDWLASEFMAGGWRIKPLHKLIMMSSTYRQASVHPQHQQYAERDFTNRLWWRFNRRRLDAESLRDAVLTVCGTLNSTMGGPSFVPQMSDEALEGLSRKGNQWKESSSEERSRRSVYMMTKRQRILPMMTAFDFCDSTRPCGKRDVTTVAPQALAMLNNHFIHQQSDSLANRIASEAGDEIGKRVELAWQYVLGREPREEETAMAVQHLREQSERFRAWQFQRQSNVDASPRELNVKQKLPELLALASLCHVLLNTNEFLYVD